MEEERKTESGMEVETERTKLQVGTMDGGDSEGREKACEPGIGEVTGRTKGPVGTKDGRNGEEGNRRGGARKEGWWRDGQGKWGSTVG